MNFDLIIHGGALVTGRDMLHTDLGIRDGRIVAWGALERESAAQRVDASGLLVLPGAVDPHVHLAMPAGDLRTADDWRSGTLAAACGGVTTVLDFVEPEAGQSLLDALAQRRAEAEAGAVIDFGLHVTLTNAAPETLAQIPDVVAAGASSFKTYTTYAGFALDDVALLAVMEAVAAAGGLTLTHCENDAIVQRATAYFLERGLTAPRHHPRSRPAAAEGEAIERVLALAEVAGVSAYIVHISTARGVGALARAQQRGQRAYGETCPHYLLLTDTEYERPGFEGAKFVCAPPLRTAEDHAALWDALKTGVLHTVGTDHCAFNFDGQKDLGRDDFSRIPSGLPGIEVRLALLHTFGVGWGRLSLNRWVEVCCENPARIFGLYPRKGTLAPGADADIVLFDPQKRIILSTDTLHEAVDYTPYAGLKLEGYPVAVYARGALLAQNGVFVGEGARGRYLAREKVKEEE